MPLVNLQQIKYDRGYDMLKGKKTSVDVDGSFVVPNGEGRVQELKPWPPPSVLPPTGGYQGRL